MELRNEQSAQSEKQEQDVTLTPESVAAESAENLTEAMNAEEVVTEKTEATVPVAKSKAEVVASLESLLDMPIEKVKDEVSQLKAMFYTIRKQEVEAEKAAFVEAGNDEAAFTPAEDADESRVKDILAQLKERRAAYLAALEAKRQANLDAKEAIINEISAIANDADNINKQYSRVQQLQQDFKTIGEVPAEHVTDLWKRYQRAVENFYDLLKMNKELRDYDFKKNLELKQGLCEEAEQLSKEEGIVDVFNRLQELHEKWRGIGPVAKELREELWGRFKDASSIINKRYQTFFEERKEKERANEEAKTALCEKVEAVSTDGLKTYASWDEATKTIIGIQEEWKKLGFASRKVNAALFARFRKACDDFFEKKAAFFKSMKEEFASNLEKKLALCEKAEALKDSQEWKKTSDALVALQKEWKTIGPVVKKHSDAVWKRFIAACDYFFEQKGKLTNNQRQIEHANLKAKKAVIAEINEVLEFASEEDGAKKVRELMKTWQGIGFVPFKEKDKLYAEYKKAVDAAFDKFDMKETRANLANFENSINQMSDAGKMNRERERLVRTYEQKRNELKTFENNFAFFNVQSKSGNSMVKEMERRAQKIKEEIALLEQKIKLIDSKI